MTTRTLEWVLANDERAVRNYEPANYAGSENCARCGKRLRRMADLVEIYDHRTGGYPSDWRTTVVGLFHNECAPDRGYVIMLNRLLSDKVYGPKGWGSHLLEKNWWAPTYNHDLQHALQVGHKIAARLQGQDQRRTGGPANPRNLSIRTRALVMERDGFRCRRCGAGPDDGACLVVDHIQPVAAGGSGAVANLQTLCTSCNGGKADRLPHDHDTRPFVRYTPT